MRFDVVDIIKGIAIIMIVNVHLISGPFFSVGETFHVVAFFFASGVIHAEKEKWQVLSVGQFFRERAARLLYPYFALSCCYICFHLFLNAIRGDQFFNSVITDSLIKTAVLKGIGTLWFLPVLFLGEILFFIAKKYRFSDFVILLIGLGIVAVSSYLNSQGICGVQWYGNYSFYGLILNNPVTLLLSSLIASFFIELGFVCYKTFPGLFLNESHSLKFYLLVALVCVLSLITDFLCLGNYRGDLHKLDIGNPCFYLLCSVSGILFVCTLSVLIARFCKHLSSLFKFLGKNSLIVMTTHTEYYVNSIAFLAVSSFVSALGVSISNKMLSGISLFVILLLETGIVFIVNRSFLKYLYTFPKRREIVAR